MTFDWKTYLQIARFFSQGTFEFGQEAAERCGVSRAYYAAYHHALDYAIRQHRFQPKGEGTDHGALIAHYRVRRMRQISDRLWDLRQWRQQCDYDDTVFNLSTMLDSAILRTQELIDRLT